MSLQVIDEKQYSPEVHYGTGRYTFTREEIGTPYVQLGVRILVDPNDPADMKKVHALQHAIKVEQPGGPGRFEAPNWGSGKPEEGPRRAARIGHDPPGYKAHVRPQGSGRSGTAPDWNRHGLWRQS